MVPLLQEVFTITAVPLPVFPDSIDLHHIRPAEEEEEYKHLQVRCSGSFISRVVCLHLNNITTRLTADEGPSDVVQHIFAYDIYVKLCDRGHR